MRNSKDVGNRLVWLINKIVKVSQKLGFEKSDERNSEYKFTNLTEERFYLKKKCAAISIL